MKQVQVVPENTGINVESDRETGEAVGRQLMFLVHPGETIVVHFDEEGAKRCAWMLTATADEIAEENARLRAREALDVKPGVVPQGSRLPR